MSRRVAFSAPLCLAFLTVAAAPAAAQPLGTFRWQLQPYCNVLTVTVTQSAIQVSGQTNNQYRLEGFDDQCGAPSRAAVHGVVVPNPDGTFEFGVTIVTSTGATPAHIDVTLNPATLGGSWRDSSGNSGTLVFNPGAAGGPARPTGIGAVAINPNEVQRRVTESCPTGTFMRGVNVDGSVICATESGGGTITGITAGDGLTGGGTAGTVSLAVDFAGSGTATTVARSDHSHEVRVSGGDCPAIQQAIDALPPTGGHVIVNAGTYVCADFIHIDRDNVVLEGVGPATLLRLADNSDSPVIVIGQRIAVPTTTRSRIRVANLRIDGNRINQTVECYRGACSPANPLRNNGLTLRRVNDVIIENVMVSSTRSGGLVTELTCRRLTVRDFTSSDNAFDGVAFYQTEDSVFSGLHLHNNAAAGISADIDFNGNLLSDTTIANSGKVGVFIRDSRDNVFSNLRVRDSAEDGVFCAQVDTDVTTACSGNTFKGLMVSGSVGAGFRINDASCTDNLIDASQFFNNTAGCISEATPGLAQTGDNRCR